MSRLLLQPLQPTKRSSVLKHSPTLLRIYISSNPSAESIEMCGEMMCSSSSANEFSFMWLVARNEPLEILKQAKWSRAQCVLNNTVTRNIHELSAIQKHLYVTDCTPGDKHKFLDQ